MKKSRVLTLGLACFFTAVTAFSAVAATSGGGALYSHLNDTSQSETTLSQEFSQADVNNANNIPKIVENTDGSIQIGMSQEETESALMNGTWECAPETDPVIYTTDYGLDIKWHLTGYKSDVTTIGKLSSGKFSGYAYISAGGMNWAIIGRSSNITEPLSGQINIGNVVSKFSAFSGYASNSIWAYLNNGGYEITSTPAGAAVYNDRNKQYAYGTSATGAYANLTTIFPNAKVISDTSILATNEVLCFAQGCTHGDTEYTSGGRANQYSTSNLKSVLDSWYDVNLKSSYDSYIVSKTLLTTYTGGVAADSCTAKLFPLAGQSSSESFYYGTYLTEGSDGDMDIDVIYYTRSGYEGATKYAYVIDSSGKLDHMNYTSVYYNYCVRPAFVLQL